MAELMADPLNQNGSSESTELMTLIEAPVETNKFDLFPPEILDGILRKLDEHSLSQSRLVCRKWNDLALPILSKIPGTVEFRLNGYDGMKTQGRTERIQKLHSILNSTKYPQMFFSKLTLRKGELENDIQLINLLKKFGSILKSLELRSITLSASVLGQILEIWCANLEELTLHKITISEDTNTTITSIEASPCSLTLKLRKFMVYDCELDEELDEQPPPYAENAFVSILKGSPKLQVLHMDIKHGFWTKMQNLPEITKNLQEVNITIDQFGEGISDLSVLSESSFSNKLNSLTLNIHGDEDESFPKKQLVRLLYKVGESLEKLVLHLFLSLDWKIKPNLQFPLMKKLKLLEYYFQNNLIFDTIDMLQKMPNLEILRFSRYPYPEETIELEFLDTLFSNVWYLPMHPHRNLNTLVFRGYVRDAETIFAMNRMLPSLHELTLETDCRKNIESTKECWLIRICTGFSEMKNLNILHLSFHHSVKWDQQFNFEACFSPLQASQSLQELTLTRKRKSTCCDSENLPPGLEKALVKIPQLKLINLNRFNIEKSESIELFKRLEQKGILLKENCFDNLERWDF